MSNSNMVRRHCAIGLGLATMLWLMGCSKDPVGYAPPLPKGTRISPQKPTPSLALEHVVVPVTNTLTTLIGFRRTSDPPWTNGNFLTFIFRKPQAPGEEEERARWNVVNIHSENFSQITHRLGIPAVEVLVLHTKKDPLVVQEADGRKYKAIDDVGYALVTDPRIPREWLLFEPRGDREIGRQLKAGYPKCFRASD